MKTTYKLVLSALFLDIGLLLPFLTGQIPQIGNLLLPMHLPVFLCAFICGWQYGAAVGLIVPILRSMVFSRPLFYPTALGMAVELAVYGLVAGLIYNKFKQKNVKAIYGALIPAMLIGRMAWGMTQVVLWGAVNDQFTWKIFVAEAFVNAIPGIVLQLVLIPAIMSLLHWTKLLKYENMR